MAINSFNSPPQRDGASYVSTIDWSNLIALTTGDAYFNDSSKVFRVDIMYGETSDARQSARIQHYGGEGNVRFTPEAKAGTWRKEQVKLYDHDGATHLIKRDEGVGITGISGDLILT